MVLTAADKKKIVNFINEGEKISVIRRVHFPQCTYGEIYSIAHERTDGSSLGIKKKITNRLTTLAAGKSKQEKEDLKEIRGLVSSLYKQHKDMSAKLAEIREVLE